MPPLLLKNVNVSLQLVGLFRCVERSLKHVSDFMSANTVYSAVMRPAEASNRWSMSAIAVARARTVAQSGRALAANFGARTTQVHWRVVAI